MTDIKLDTTTLLILAALTVLVLLALWAYADPTSFEPVHGAIGAINERLTDPIGAKGRYFP